jgi:hypothetical protein
MNGIAQEHLAPWFACHRQSRVVVNDSCLDPRSWTSEYFRRFFRGSTVFVSIPPQLERELIHVGEVDMRRAAFEHERYCLFDGNRSVLLRHVQNVFPVRHCCDPFQVATIVRGNLDVRAPHRRFLFFVQYYGGDRPLPLVVNCARIIIGEKIVTWNINFNFLFPVAESVLTRVDSDWSLYCLTA